MLGIVAGLGMIGFLVFFHELGHFLIAKLFGIGVPVFSIGMGPRAWGFEYHGTEYRFSWLPVGGYVQLAGADPFGDADYEALVDPKEDFLKRPVWQRLAVMVAGPAFNLALPFAVFTAVLMAGEPQPDATIGAVLPHTPLAEAGVLPGDRVIAVEGQEVEVWADLTLLLSERIGQDTRITVARGETRRDVAIPGKDLVYAPAGVVDIERVGAWWGPVSSRVGVDDPRSPFGRAGLRTGDIVVAINGEPTPDWATLAAKLKGDVHEVSYKRATAPNVTLDELRVNVAAVVPAPDYAPHPLDPFANPWGAAPVMVFAGDVDAGSPAEKGGLKAQDRILAVDGVPVESWSHLLALVADSAPSATEAATPRPLKILFVRDGSATEATLQPVMHQDVVLADIRYRPIVKISQYPYSFSDGPIVEKYYGLFEALPRAVEETRLVVQATLGMLSNLLTGQTRIQDTLGGPVEIMRIASEDAAEGIFTFARRIGVISISLGIVNLLPVPVLDGGQILIYAIEGLRGRPLSVALRERLQMGGVLALVALSLLVLVFDINRLIFGEA